MFSSILPIDELAMHKFPSQVPDSIEPFESFASPSELEFEILDGPPESLIRKYSEALGDVPAASTQPYKKIKRTRTWHRIESIDETDELLVVPSAPSTTSRAYVYDPSLRPYKATMLPGGGYEISVDKGYESNRVFRFIPANRFLILKIKPTKGFIDAFAALDLDLIFTFPHTGITKKWTFVSSSDSRLRAKDQKSVFFFEEGNDYTVQDVLAAFGDTFAVLRQSGIGKFFSRFGLNFSTTTPTITVNMNQIANIPDITAPDGKDYTDGCGCMSRRAAVEVARMLRLDYVPSVFQFRFAGPKGVLVPFDDEYLRKWFPDDFGKDVEIYLRGSQIKYDAWDYLTLDISDWSRSKSSFRCAKLQKAMIRILLDLGIPLKNFERLLEAELDRLSTVLDDRAKAINWLEGKSAVLESGEPYPTDTALRMLAAGYDLSEPRLHELLGNLLRKELQGLREKLHIPIPNSLYLFGICDESMELGKDQIYCHAGIDGFIEGTVLLTRSPMMDPGDIRVVEAIRPSNGSAYSLHSNCVVFPMQGDQPMADEMSGGDLDGDKYLISWNPLIIPTDSDPPNPRQKKDETVVVKHVDPEKVMFALKEHIAKRITSSDIGQTAKEWEQAVNGLALGSRDPYCLALSERYERCLDTGKTGEQIKAMPLASLKGPKTNGTSPFDILDAIIIAREKKLLMPWTFGRGDQTSAKQKVSFALDPDLLYYRDTLEFQNASKEASTKIQTYWKEYYRLKLNVFGRNQPISGIRYDSDSKASSSEMATKALFNEKVDAVMRQLREEYFPRASDIPENNHSNAIRASAFYVFGYKRMLIGLATPIELIWCGEPWLNALKARKAGGIGPAPCITSILATEDMLAKTLSKRVPKLMTSTALGVGDSEVKEKEGSALAKNAEPLFLSGNSEVECEDIVFV